MPSMLPTFPRKYEYSVVREATGVEFKSVITDRWDALRFIRDELQRRDRECMYVIYLNNRNQVIGFELATIGNMVEMVLVPRDLLRGAIIAGARSIILMHNHPSGDYRPSGEDVKFTHRMDFACSVVGVKLLDHFVVGEPARMWSIPREMPKKIPAKTKKRKKKASQDVPEQKLSKRRGA